jgi:hypothetical protein
VHVLNNEGTAILYWQHIDWSSRKSDLSAGGLEDLIRRDDDSAIGLHADLQTISGIIGAGGDERKQ